MNSLRGSILKLGIAGVVILLMGALLWTALQTPVKGKVSGFTAMIGDVSGLTKGADVRMAGVQVGKVTDIVLDGTVAKVSFSVRDDQTVYDNTQAAVLFQSLVGQRYLALLQKDRPGSVLQPGSVIPIERTQSSFDISELFDAVRPIFDTISSGTVDKFLENLLLVMSGDGRGLGPVMDDLNTIIGVAGNQIPLVNAIADNMDAIVAKFDGKAPLIDKLLGQALDLVKTVHGRLDLLRDLVDNGVPGLKLLMPWLDGVLAIYYDNFAGFERLYNRYVPAVAVTIVRQSLAAIPLVVKTISGLFLTPDAGKKLNCLTQLPIPMTILIGTERMKACQ
ncbi:Mce family protein [Gordonia effusa NBRC 100432]|uniref:Mce family protein n=1 Tax=Gordonia effusa NBRC 100432 TaxID=1077974 RepID=H0R4X6_9ACTN|nr:MCE family protein [Gordonia effusa]GAB20127.1 Mce family protein [Gordonia effusa NBRC 100432]